MILSIHISIVHFTIVGIVLGTLLLLYSVIFKKQEVLQIVLIALAILSFSVAICAKTGEEAEEIVEEMAKGDKCEELVEHLIHEHEEMAEKVIPLAIFSGIVLLLSFFAVIKKHKRKNIIVIIATLLCVVLSVFISLTGRLGGEISHKYLNDEYKECLK